MDRDDRITSAAEVRALRQVELALTALRAGQPVVLVDDPGREGEADLVIAAEHVTPEWMAYFVRHTSGLICCALSPELVDTLALPPMVTTSTERHDTAFTVSVDLVTGTTTGISAADRAATIRALGDPESRAEDFARPGHVFPLRARLGGVLERRGHTEASVDLATMAGCRPAAAICELVNRDGSIAGAEDAVAFAEEQGLVVLTIDDVVRHRRLWDRASAAARVPSDSGELTVQCADVDGREHVVVSVGDVRGADVLVRVHSECFTGDVLGSRRCDCGEQLRAALDAIEREGRGVVVYVRGHEGRGIGLRDKLRAYALQDLGLDTVDANLALGHPADAREYAAPARILKDLGVESIRLLSNNPRKVEGLTAHGVAVSERVPLVVPAGPSNVAYLSAKQDRLGHRLGLDHDTVQVAVSP